MQRKRRYRDRESIESDSEEDEKRHKRRRYKGPSRQDHMYRTKREHSHSDGRSESDGSEESSFVGGGGGQNDSMQKSEDFRPPTNDVRKSYLQHQRRQYTAH